MKSPVFLAVLGVSLSILPAADADDRELAARLQKRIDAFHRDAEPNGEKLRLVYFHPADTEPQKHYRERVRRIVDDFADYYHAEMKAAGFTSPRIPLEMAEEDDLVIHLVKGSGKSDDYTYESGARVKSEIQKALAGKIDFDNDFVLVLGGMCQKRGKNDYFFHAPYYGEGGSNQIWGLCYAADSEILDPVNLTEARAKEPMKFEEHNGTYKMPVARFNSWYLGGIAHELGHGLSLPHNGQLPVQKLAKGNALMGAGNRTYREERWGGGKGSFMTLASCLRLAVHPIFTGSDRERFSEASSHTEGLEFEGDGGKGMTIRGKLHGTPEILAVIAYCDPPDGAGYNALTWVSEVDKEGRFEIEAKHHTPGPHELRLAVVHLSGAVGRVNSRYVVNANGEPDTQAILARMVVQPVEEIYLNGGRQAAAKQAEKMLETPADPKSEKMLQHLITLADPPKPIDLASVKDDRVSLSDVKWKSAQVGWGKPARNEYYTGPGISDAVFLELGGEFFEKGLYAHAPSEYGFTLDGSWKTFEATVGLQGGVGPLGRSRFIVKGDGKVLFTSKLLKGMESQKVKVDIDGVQDLRLVVESGIKGNPQCWSVWGAPVVSR